MSNSAASEYSRRKFLMASASTAAATPLVARALGPQPASAQSPARNANDRIGVSMEINGQIRKLQVDPRTTLLDALREKVQLTGTKKGCDHGQCGACTVHVDGTRILSCLTLAASLEGKKITTIEGLTSAGGALHPMQQAFVDNDAFQCGYCTPGQIMSAVACVHEGHAENDGDIREYMSGNLCRCAAYPNIVAAIKQAKSEMKGA